jgi:hypothetical protein
LTLTVTAGLDGSTVNDDTVTVTGTAQATGNSAVIVNGIVATLDASGQFFVDDVPLVPGPNTILVSLNNSSGSVATQTITVNSNGSTPFAVRLDKQQGIAPLTTSMTITNRGHVPFSRIDVTSNSSIVFSIPSLDANDQAVYRLTFPSPSTYSVTVTAYGQNNAVLFSTTKRIYVYDAQVLAAQLQLVYTGMLDRLRSGDIAGALTAVTGSRADDFQSLFADLGSDLATVVDQLGVVQQVTFTDSLGEILLTRQSTQGPQSFTIYLLRGRDGVWRIDGM